MPDDVMRYDLMAQEALRGVVREALKRVAAEGLPGEHHFYITFLTNAPGVVMSERLKAQYPEEMTVVLEHQFWNLEADEDHFSVELSFNSIPEMLSVPYSSIRGFFDPSVQFGLQFQVEEEDDAPDLDAPQPDGDEASADETGGTGEVVSLDAFRKK